MTPCSLLLADRHFPGRRALRMQLAALAATLLCACQSPLVPVRSLSYRVQLNVDGQAYKLKSDYVCHKEDPAWITLGSGGWHMRAGGDGRIVGKLVDGRKFAVFPRSNYSLGPEYVLPCAEKTEAVMSRVFIELPSGEAESFDKPHTQSANRRIGAFDSTAEFKTGSFDTYQPQENWESVKSQKTKTSTRFYSVWLTEYTNKNWVDRPAIGEKIKTRTIAWLEPGTSIPFVDRSAGKIEHSYEISAALRWPHRALSMKPHGTPQESWLIDSPTDSTIWHPVQPATDNTPPKQHREITRWVNYKGGRIEIALGAYSRIFYDPSDNLIIRISVNQIDLW